MRSQAVARTITHFAVLLAGQKWSVMMYWITGQTGCYMAAEIQRFASGLIAL
ncbi:hypothetical protein KCP76_18695 [Salmonella enterica subsp. enterica serovar Weltevreden]|nr:hypothetical protein KCP76_18695 [Salmonella enterica subsp. enterica serovar Weltevreden]